MKGVAKIKGALNPKIGEATFYEVVEFHKGTIVIDPNTIKWKLYQFKDGKWDELSGSVKTGKKVSYNFPQKWYTKKLLIEAYIYDAEGKAPPGIIVKPCMGERKIKNTEILNIEGKPIAKTPKYGQSILLRATTENMLGEILKLSVWERDTYSDKGHDPNGNQLLWSGNSKKVNNKGFGEQTIMLSPDMMTKAGKSMFDGSEHEYYLLVEADKMKTISATTQVSTEIVLSPGNHQVAKKDPIPEKETSLIDQAIVKIKNATGWEPITVEGITNAIVDMFSPDEKIPSCEQKYCIKKGDKSELIREINIRLAGFGGNVPTDEFTDRTEKMIKQFQKDYMKVPETGKVCGNVLKAIDEFSSKFDISATLWGQLKCSCDTKGKQTTSKLRKIKELNSCNGFGDHTGKNTYKATPNNESNHNYEYPGIHRSLLFGIKALQFYFSLQTVYTMDHITSGYRCRFKNYKTTNHQGKAIDIQFSKGDWEIRYAVKKNLKALEDIRDSFYIKYLGAQKNWPGENLFSTEPIDLLYYPDGSLRYDHTFSWLHIDVRQFESKYLEDKYFCKNSTDLNDESIIKLAKNAGFAKTCMCMPSKASANSSPTIKSATTCEDKFKKVAQIILNHEGGYVNHPSDKGGPTNKGITQATWNKFAMSDVNKEPTLDNLKTITDDDATKIYWKRYWEPKGFCKITDEKVSLMIYDWTITSGGAIKQVQKLLVNEFEKEVSIDGGIGNQTITAINNIQDQDKLLKRLGEIRKEYYTDLTFTKGKKNTQDVFLKGWHNRVDDCLNFKP